MGGIVSIIAESFAMVSIFMSSETGSNNESGIKIEEESIKILFIRRSFPTSTEVSSCPLTLSMRVNNRTVDRKRMQFPVDKFVNNLYMMLLDK